MINLAQEPTPPLLIGLCGRAGSGKSTVASMLAFDHTMVELAFADPILDMLCALFEAAGIDGAHATERSLKEQPTPLGYSYRHLAQTLGTGWGRSLAPDFWVRVMERRVSSLHGIGDSVVISDVRFPNEAEWLRARGGILVRVERRDLAPVREHESEQHVDAMAVDATIWNYGSEATLADQVAALVDGVHTRAAA